MKYEKPPLSLDDQVELLLRRGMSGDQALMRDRLAVVNYYRLSGYWHHLKNKDDDSFKQGTCFDTVWRQYSFDRALRLLVMDAIERIEVAVRTQLAYHHSRAFTDPFAYSDNPASLPGMSPGKRGEFLITLADEMRRSRETFVEHFRAKYGDVHRCLPLWMATEVMSFGSILRFFRGVPRHVQNEIATHFRLPFAVFDSWLLTLNAIRNICAHHGRLWNRSVAKPKMPFGKSYPEWQHPVEIRGDRIFGVLTLCNYCLDFIAPQSSWPCRLRQLLSDSPHVPLLNMGFPENWLESPLWKRAIEGGTRS